MSVKSKVLATAAALALVGGVGTAGVLGTTGAADAASTATLPAYPATTTLNLGSPYCITDDVIMNDPLDSTSPIVETYGSAGSPQVTSHADPPVTYWMKYLDDTTNTWKPGPPPDTQLNNTTGELAAYNPTGDAPSKGAGWQLSALASVAGTNTYTVRDQGVDSVGAAGVEQFQVTADDSGSGSAEVTTLTYQGNTYNNANGALTIQLNSGSTVSTSLTLSAIASSLNIPDVGNVGATPVTFTLVGSPGWLLNGGTTGTVLTGTDASDPEIEATTPDGDAVFFTLSGISVTSGGVFYLNSDADACVTAAVTAPPPVTATATSYGNEVNKYGNGFDVDRQHFGWGTPIIVWPATQADPATHFIATLLSDGNFTFEAAPYGTGDGLCISNPGGGDLFLRTCNGSIFQQLTPDGSYLESAAGGGIINPHGKGSRFTAGGSATPWGGSAFTWTPYSQLPA